LTSETGVTIAFESAIVPKWKDSRISFKNVYISRRPHGAAINGAQTTPRDGVHRAAARLDIGNHPAYHDVEEEDDAVAVAPDNHQLNELKYSLFDLDVDSIDVTLSLWRWLDGKGLVKDATIKGVRGVLGMRSIRPI
jgi:mitochondrial distribution and morphology protein 31